MLQSQIIFKKHQSYQLFDDNTMLNVLIFVRQATLDVVSTLMGDLTNYVRLLL